MSDAVHSLGCRSWKLRTIKSEAPSFASPYAWCLLISTQHRQIYLLATIISHAVNIPTLTGSMVYYFGITCEPVLIYPMGALCDSPRPYHHV